MPMSKKLLYWDFVRVEAKHIGSDGCTLVSELFRDCCLEHDLSYYCGKDPRSAYRFYRNLCAGHDYWYFADAIERSEADDRFKKCIQDRSKLGKWSPISWVRWLGVKVGGWKPWNTHRKER